MAWEVRSGAPRRYTGRHRHGGDEVERLALLTERLSVAHRQTQGQLGKVTDETLRANRAPFDDTLDNFNAAAAAALWEVRRAENDRDALLAILEAMRRAVKIHMQDRSDRHALLSADVGGVVGNGAEVTRRQADGAEAQSTRKHVPRLLRRHVTRHSTN
jgi:hypothetical protein